MLALLALAAVVIAVVAVVNGSVANDGDGGSAAGQRTETTTKDSGSGNGDGAENPRTYVVESGDLLSTIAEKFGVSVDRLVRLNPDVDPQTLNPGTELTIR